MKFLTAPFRFLWEVYTSREIAPGVYWRGGYLYENINEPTTPRPLKFKTSK